MSTENDGIEIQLPESSPKGRLSIVLPWVVVVGLMGLLGWHKVEDRPVTAGYHDEQADVTRERLEERQARVERKLDATNAKVDAQFDAIVRQLDRIETRLDRK